jgi:hypothetical protein
MKKNRQIITETYFQIQEPFKKKGGGLVLFHPHKSPSTSPFSNPRHAC